MSTVSLNPTKDTRISQTSVDTNYGTEDYIEIYAAASNKRKCLLSFDMSASIASGSTINSAELRLQCTAGTSGRTVKCYRLLRTDWVEGEATWNVYKTGSSWGTAGAGNSSTDYSTTDAAEHATETSYDYLATWDVTKQVQTALDSVAGVTHFLLVDEGADANIWQDYDSKEGTTKPVLYIDYTAPVPTSINIGDAWKAIDWTGSKINIGDSWKTIVAVYINIGDAWKTVYS